MAEVERPRQDLADAVQRLEFDAAQGGQPGRLSSLMRLTPATDRKHHAHPTAAMFGGIDVDHAVVVGGDLLRGRQARPQVLAPPMRA